MSTELNSGEKTAHLALPLRWSVLNQANRAAADTACTYDVDSKGARLVSSRAPRLGDLLTLERGRNKAICQVTWVADPTSDLRGQFAVRCVDGRAPWEEELRQAEEQIPAARFGGPEPAPLWSPDYRRANKPAQASAIPRRRPGGSD